VSVTPFVGRVAVCRLLFLVWRAPVFDRDVQHHGDDDHGRQERRSGK
jgi:hypothetical protein